jgi:membrane-associated protease RseP (regulator of RpoE activity)
MEPYSLNEPVSETLSDAVRQVMAITDITHGDEAQGYAIRYRGRLLVDSQEAFKRLDSVFHDSKLTLLLREENDQHVILGVLGTIQPQPSNPWINVALFLLTIVSMMFAGAQYGLEGPIEESFSGVMTALFGNLSNGVIFTGSLLGILTAHEFGHYFAARYHKTEVSLPYFIPFPSLFGTMGAFIRLKEPPRNKRVLLDIGLAGPLAGLVVAIPVLLLGIALSEISYLPESPQAAAGSVLEGNSLLYLGAKYLITGELLPMPLSYGGTSPLLYWLKYLFVGLPMPFGGRDILMHPMAWAGWAGLLVTALNLIPSGQLDGGHTIYVLFGRAAARIRPFLLIALLMLGFVWTGWYIWAILIFAMGRTFATPRDDLTPLDPKRKILAYLGIFVFILVFIPVPLRIF